MVESSLVAWSLPVVIQIPIFRSLWKKSVTTWITRNDGVRRIKILLCFHTKYLAAGLCEFCQLNKIRESQGEDNQAFVVVFSYKKICLQGYVSFTTLHKNWELRGEKWSCWGVFVQENFLCRMWISFTTWTKIQKQWDEENEAIGWLLYKIICLQDAISFTIWTLRMMSWGEWSCWDFLTRTIVCRMWFSFTTWTKRMMRWRELSSWVFCTRTHVFQMGISFTTWTPGMTRWRESSSWVFLDFGTTTLSVVCEFHTLKIRYDSVRENWALAFEYRMLSVDFGTRTMSVVCEFHKAKNQEWWGKENWAFGFWLKRVVCGVWIS